MMTLDVLNRSGEKTSTVQLDETKLGDKVHLKLLKEAVLMYEANRRQGTGSSKGRSEVVGSNRKIYRQTGTGHARKGRNRTPVRRGGGAAVGPKPRDFGWARANPLMPVIVNEHTEGHRPTSDSFCRIDKTNVLLTTLKRAEDGDGFIVRLVETEGRQSDVSVQLPFIEIAEAARTDLVERDLGPLTCERHSVAVSVKPFGITTIRLRAAN